jgi:hypothetical protein
VTEAPDAAEGVNTQPDAEPRFEKSLAFIPDTDSENDTPKDSVIPAAGEPGEETTAAVGASRSIVIDEEVVAADGPVWDVTEDVTAS